MYILVSSDACDGEDNFIPSKYEEGFQCERDNKHAQIHILVRRDVGQATSTSL